MAYRQSHRIKGELDRCIGFNKENFVIIKLSKFEKVSRFDNTILCSLKAEITQITLFYRNVRCKHNNL